MDSDVFDRSLPPVDRGGWDEYTRRRMEQYARERIAASGTFAGQGGDWLQRAAQRIDQLLPDDAAQGPPAGGVGPTPGSISERAPTAPLRARGAPLGANPALPVGADLWALMDASSYSAPPASLREAEQHPPLAPLRGAT